MKKLLFILTIVCVFFTFVIPENGYSQKKNMIVTAQASIHADSTKIITGCVLIKSGGVLSVYGTILFSANAGVIIENGGKMIVDGGTLTNLENNGWWDGIELWGNGSYTQSDMTRQGNLVLRNATISNSLCGIYVGRVSEFAQNNLPNGTKKGGVVGPYIHETVKIPYLYYSYGYPNSGGGLIQAENTLFINNKTSVYFTDYNKGNSSYFKGCKFSVDNQRFGFNKPAEAGNMVLLRNVMGIKFSKCSFSNNISQLTPSQLLKIIGIKSYNSVFSVNSDYRDTNITSLVGPDHLPPSQTIFKNLGYGIHAVGTGSTTSYKVEYSKFQYNRYGIYNSAVDNISITDNEFEMKPTISEDIYSTGLYLNGSTAYHIEGNLFKGVDTFGNVPEVYTENSIGVLVNESGENVNMIYNNTLQYLYSGLHLQGLNKNITDHTGLCFICNDFSNDYSDVNVLLSSPDVERIEGIAKNQGSKTLPARNTFSKNENALHASDINTEACEIDYFYNGINNTTYKVRPENITDGLVYRNPVNIGYNKADCPRINLASGIQSYYNAAVTARQNMNNYRTSLLSSLDGGNTTTLINQIKNTTASSVASLKSTLLRISPFLSLKAITAVIDNRNIDNVTLKDIMVQNSHACRDDKIKQKLRARVPALTAVQLNQILLASVKENAKDALENQLQAASAEFIYNYSIAGNYYLTQGSASQWNNLLNGVSDLELMYSNALYYKLNGNMSQAASIMINLNNRLQQSYEAVRSGNSYSTYIELLDNNTIKGNMDYDKFVILYDMSFTPNSRPEIMAMNLVDALGVRNYQSPIYRLEDLNLYKRQEAMLIDDGDLNTNEFFKVYPNPSYGEISIKYSVDKNINPILIIYDLNGKIKYRESLDSTQTEHKLLLHGLSSGEYIVALSVDGKILNSQKILIK